MGGLSQVSKTGSFKRKYGTAEKAKRLTYDKLVLLRIMGHFGNGNGTGNVVGIGGGSYVKNRVLAKLHSHTHGWRKQRRATLHTRMGTREGQIKNKSQKGTRKQLQKLYST